MRGWTLVLGLAACSADMHGPDAAPPARCDPSQPFGAPALVGGINTDQPEASARLSPDELQVTFARQATGVWDLWAATRASADDAFDPPALVTSVNSVASDVWPTESPDGLTLFFDADRTTPNVFHIWRSTRASTDAPFGPPQPRPELMDKDQNPMLANATALYFASTVRGGLGKSEILRADVSDTGAIGSPVLLVGGVNTADAEAAPAVTADERAIYFVRQIGTESDVYTASRSTATDGFGNSTAVPGLDAPGIDEVPTWVSPDNCRLYFQSDAPGGPAGSNIWMAARPL